MKKYLLLLICCLFSISGFAQKNDNANQTFIDKLVAFNKLYGYIKSDEAAELDCGLSSIVVTKNLSP